MARQSTTDTPAKAPTPAAPRGAKLDDFEELKNDILQAYEQSVSIPDAEKLAAKFLYAQMKVSDLIKSSDLDARMRKAGLKTVSATVYLAEIQKHEKKPTETYLESQVAINAEVNTAQDFKDNADVNTEALKRYFEIFKDAHIYFRAICKGSYE